MGEIPQTHGALIVADQSLCGAVRAQLKMCLLNTECCKKEKITPRQCITRKHPSVPPECFLLFQKLNFCKRATVDMRQRLRPRNFD